MKTLWVLCFGQQCHKYEIKICRDIFISCLQFQYLCIISSISTIFSVRDFFVCSSVLSLFVCPCRDIMSIYKEPPPGMFVVPDPQDMTKVKWQNPPPPTTPRMM